MGLPELPKCNIDENPLILLEYLPNSHEKWYCSICKKIEKVSLKEKAIPKQQPLNKLSKIPGVFKHV